jgi:hypothetical protein
MSYNNNNSNIARLKLHSLQSVWTSRRLPEGNPKINNEATLLSSLPSLPDPTFETTYTQDPYLNAKITHLHALARQGVVEGIQLHIDCYLPAVAYLEQNNSSSNAPQARMMVSSIPDAPQLGTLPDLGPVIRSMLLCSEPQWGFIQTPLYSALPSIHCPAKSKAPTGNNIDTHQAALCILLALLLGTYPTCVKFPPFPVRVALYRRVHCLLTHGTGTAFCQKCPALLTLALMEYCSYVLPTYLPVEHGLLAAEGNDGLLFTTCQLACDSFRQEILVTGEESWETLEAYCVPIVERHTRACKSRAVMHSNDQMVSSKLGNNNNNNNNSKPELFQSIKLCPASIQHLPDLPIIVPYGIHLDDPTHKIMGSEMRFLGIHQATTAPSAPSALAAPLTPSTPLKPESKPESKALKLEHAVALQRTIHAKPLPQNLTQIQIKALAHSIRKCERSALSGSILYACIQCIMAGQQAIHRKGKTFPTRGQCKLDLDTEDLICSVCHNHSIISISALGRIISIKNHQFYLAPCCCSVQPYTGRGDEFQLQNPPQPCPHKPVRPPSKTTKRRCELCTNIALVDAHQAVDHLTAESHTTYLCQRHTPHADALRHVVNWSQLQEEIRKRDKPLFFHKRSGLSGRGRRRCNNKE